LLSSTVTLPAEKGEVTVAEGDTLQISYVLDDVVALLRAGRNRKLFERRRVRASVLDDFLLSGRFNSVLGLEGFRMFKTKLRRLATHLNDADFGPHLLGTDDAFEALLASGVHYTAAAAAPLAPTERRLATFRWVARRLAATSSTDLALLTARFVAEAREPAADAREALLAKSLDELRAICRTKGVAPARSTATTVDRLVARCGAGVATSLVGGDDLVDLDGWLRACADALRADLLGFIGARRRPAWQREDEAW
jgi:hypothetical protein